MLIDALTTGSGLLVCRIEEEEIIFPKSFLKFLALIHSQILHWNLVRVMKFWHRRHTLAVIENATGGRRYHWSSIGYHIACDRSTFPSRRPPDVCGDVVKIGTEISKSGK